MMSSTSKQARWLFGLSIDEEVGWAFSRISSTRSDHIDGDQFGGTFAEIPSNLNWKAAPRIDLQKHLSLCLPQLTDNKLLSNHSQQYPDYKHMRPAWKDVRAIGISTIGVTDSTNKLLLKLVRKNWRPHAGNISNLIDFGRLIADFYEQTLRIANIPPIVCHNDTIAKAMAELSFFEKKPRTLFYANICEGVGGALVRSDGHLPASSFNPEYGHLYPPIEQSDRVIDHQKCGCPIHLNCFQGLMSFKRIRESLLQSDSPDYTSTSILSENHLDKDALEKIAYYIAHFCWTAALTTAPAKIIIGGRVVYNNNRLLEIVRDRFLDLNAGANEFKSASPDLLPYTELGNTSLIENAKINPNYAGICGALELARHALKAERAEAESQK